MTNGEKIMQAFPDLQIDMGELEVYMWTTIHDAIDIPLDWWNAEYKEPQTFKWCADCKEYDQEKHCCHRYSKVIRDAVAEIRQEPKTGHWIPTEYNSYADGNPVWDKWECSECGCEHNGEEYTLTAYCPDCGAKMVEP